MDKVFSFGKKLIDNLEGQKSPIIEVQNVQCSGITCKNNRCLNNIKVHTYNTDCVNQTCSLHHSKKVIKNYNLILEEKQNNKYKIYDISEGKSPENKIFMDDNAYLTLKYDNKANLDSSYILSNDFKYNLYDSGKCSLICDMKVWIADDIFVKIYYIRKIGKIKKINIIKNDSSYETTLKHNIINKLPLVGKSNCNICFEEDINLYNLECFKDHNYCVDCISKFYMSNFKCPMCRSPIKSLQSIHNELLLIEKQSKSPDYLLKIYELDNFCDKYIIIVHFDDLNVEFLKLTFNNEKIFNYIKKIMIKKMFFKIIDNKVYLSSNIFIKLQFSIDYYPDFIEKKLLEYIESNNL